jgi:hypothetical protein
MEAQNIDTYQCSGNPGSFLIEMESKSPDWIAGRSVPTQSDNPSRLITSHHPLDRSSTVVATSSNSNRLSGLSAKLMVGSIIASAVCLLPRPLQRMQHRDHHRGLGGCVVLRHPTLINHAQVCPPAHLNLPADLGYLIRQRCHMSYTHCCSSFS